MPAPPPPAFAAQPSAAFKLGAVLEGALLPPSLLLLAFVVLRIRARARKKPEDADLLPLCARATQPAMSKAGIGMPPSEPPAEPPTDCAAVTHTVRFSLADGAQVTSECALLDDPPSDLPALRALLARVGTEATRRPLDTDDLTVEYGVSADVWLTATSVTPMSAVLRASQGLRVKQAPPSLRTPPLPEAPGASGSDRATSSSAQRVAGAPDAAAGEGITSSSISPALQWLASMAHHPAAPRKPVEPVAKPAPRPRIE